MQTPTVQLENKRKAESVLWAIGFAADEANRATSRLLTANMNVQLDMDPAKTLQSAQEALKEALKQVQKALDAL